MIKRIIGILLLCSLLLTLITSNAESQTINTSIHQVNCNGHLFDSIDTTDALFFEDDYFSAVAFPTLDGKYCAFLFNKSEVVVDEAEVTIYYYDDSGNILNYYNDGHDMVLPGYTVASEIDKPKRYSIAKIEIKEEIGINPSFMNYSDSVNVKTNLGDNNVIIQITNNSDMCIEEIEYVLVFYKSNHIVSIGYAQDVYDTKSGDTVIMKENLPNVYDKYELFLNQAHTFGL